MSGGIRQRAPWWILAVLFVAVPFIEIFLLIRLGQVIGPWWTILLLIAFGVLGAWLVKREGSRTWRALQDAIASRRMPSAELADGALILVGGTLLITPGFISDVAGLFCILPFTRPAARGVLSRVITRRLTVATQAADFTQPRSYPPTERRPGHEDVIRGDVVDRD